MKENKLFEPATMPGIKVVGKIDLEGISSSVSKHEDDINHGCHSRDEMRALLDSWFPESHRHCTGLSDCQIQRYKDGDALRFTLKNGVSGLAIGRVEPLKQEIGYYIAFGMYGAGVITKFGSPDSDGEIADGYWPIGLKSVCTPNKNEIAMVDSFLRPMIEDERNALRNALLEEAMDLQDERLRQEEEERRQEEERKVAEAARAEQKEREKQEAIARIEEQRKQLIEEEKEFVDPDSPLCKGEDIDSLVYLDYVRGKKTAELDEWPRMTKPQRYRSLVYEFMSRVNSSLEKIDKQREEGVAVRNYLLSQDYFKEMISKCDEYVDRYDSFLKAAEAAGHGKLLSGSVSWLHHDCIRQTVIYVARTDKPRSWNIIYLEDDDVVLHNIFSKRSGEGNDYCQTLFASDTSIFMNNKVTQGRLTDILLCFFGMEADLRSLSEAESHSSATVPSASTEGGDVVFRTISSCVQ